MATIPLRDPVGAASMQGGLARDAAPESGESPR